MNIHCFTSISYSYLDRARVLAKSIRKFHPNWKLWVVISDELPDGLDISTKDTGFDYVINVRDLEIPKVNSWIFGHDVVELCTAVKGKTLHTILCGDCEAVVYLDPDTVLFSPLTTIEEKLQDYDVVLTPHLVSPEERRSAILDNEIGSLKHGTYNLGFVAVRASVNGIAFAEWWRDRLLEYCIDDVANGLFTDQKWCDLAPALFESVYVHRDRGLNVAAWNIGSRPIAIHADGLITAGGTVLKFFHFTKVNTVGERVLEAYTFGSTDVFELLHWYRQQLISYSVTGLPSNWFYYGYYENGNAIPKSHRRLWRTRGDAREHFINPFKSGANSYELWADANI